MDTLIIGLGNVLASDDGIGIEVARRLVARDLPPGVRVVEGATAGIGLIDLVLDSRRVIFIDAVWDGASPGTILRLDERELSRPKLRSLSSHDLGVVDVLRLGDVLYPERMPREVILYGIVAERMEPFNQGLSSPAIDAVPRVIAAVLAEINRE